MKKKISIDQLQPGMYVASTDRSWLSLPFFRRRIRNREIIAKLKSYNVCELVIDTGKGDDLEPGAASGEVDVFDHPELISQGFGASAQVHEKLMVATSQMMNDVRQGQIISEKTAETNVNLLIDQILTDPQTLLCVSVLKSSDEYTFNHCVNTAILALYVGRSLKMDRIELLKLGKGALFHDIGKCMVPLEILSKPGRLEPEEHRIIMTHVERGVDYLEKMNVTDPEIFSFTRQHHERLDGSGYPANISGDQISWWGRIAAVLDVYDAFIHENYYKDPEDPKYVLETIRANVGKLYDPKAFDALAACLGPYPPGTLLMLDSGEMALSYEPNAQLPERPRALVITHSDGTFSSSPEPIDLMAKDENDHFARSIITSMTNEDANFNPFEILQRFTHPGVTDAT